MIHLAVLMASLLGVVQDAAREWCDKLGDDSPQVREEAQKQLVKLGASAIAALKATVEKSTDPEVRDRARKALDEISRAEKLEKVYQPPKRVTVDFKGTPLRDAVAELGRQTGVRFTGANEDTPITLKVNEAPLLRVLDDISRQLKEACERPHLSHECFSSHLFLQIGFDIGTKICFRIGLIVQRKDARQTALKEQCLERRFGNFLMNERIKMKRHQSPREKVDRRISSKLPC